SNSLQDFVILRQTFGAALRGRKSTTRLSAVTIIAQLFQLLNSSPSGGSGSIQAAPPPRPVAHLAPRHHQSIDERRASSLPKVSAHGLKKRADRDRFGNVGLAAALSDALLIALHGKRGDGNHGNLAQFFVVLEPARYLKTGDLGQLDVHQDQIGAPLAGNLQSFDAAAGLQRLIAVSVQEIVKELHVELIVLHDQHGGHAGSFRPAANTSAALLVSHAVASPFQRPALLHRFSAGPAHEFASERLPTV